MKKLIQLLIFVLLAIVTKCDWWDSGSYYQIYPRSFKDSDGDGIGDLRGIADKLEYLKDLGITATWLSPIYQSPLIDYGYDISDFYAIGPEYGTMTDFDYLMQKSKETGVKVLMDFVPNHTSDEHEWFKKSVEGVDPYKDYYVWHPGKENPNNPNQNLPPSNWQAVGFGGLGDAWTWNDQRKAFYYHQFAVKQPDLNFRNPKVHEEMEKIMKFWLDKGIAGFRVDAVTHMYEVKPAADNSLPDEPPSGTTDNVHDYGYLSHIYTTDQNETFDLVYSWRNFLDNYQKVNGGDTKILMTESYSAIKTVQRYYTNGTHEGAQLPFNFELMKQLDASLKAQNVVDAIHSWLDPMPEGHYTNWVMGNHDGSRFSTRMGTERIDLFNGLVTLLPGTSVTYYGEEIGMTDVCITIDPDTKEASRCDNTINNPFIREFCRTPFQWNNSINAGFSNGSKTWLPVNENYVTVNVLEQTNKDGSHLEIFKQLLKIKKGEAGTNGTLEVEALNDNIFVIKRELADKSKKSVIAFFNFGSTYVNLANFNSEKYPEKIEIILTRSNTMHKLENSYYLSDLQLVPYELLVGTYNNAQIKKLSFVTVLISFILVLIGH